MKALELPGPQLDGTSAIETISMPLESLSSLSASLMIRCSTWSAESWFAAM